jgi:hypothetical protein
MSWWRISVFLLAAVGAACVASWLLLRWLFSSERLP